MNPSQATAAPGAPTPANVAAADAATAAALAAAVAAARVKTAQANRDRAAQRALDTGKNTVLRDYLILHHLAHVQAADVGAGDCKGKTSEAAYNALQDLASQLTAKNLEIAAKDAQLAALLVAEKEETKIKAEEE